ncbi:hypothetical protein BLNAU_12655 [Blattamonas nauphoetae]|uniref:Ubiquitin-like domain-containing protein n=1 Tax=Blattamonas nauphoetae TaxID=2049346 RepID=A0ABQ9XIY5_9EUKA|nr:hypothetical protein BLNAU_12655 [Blattamonas nauphoetae]
MAQSLTVKLRDLHQKEYTVIVEKTATIGDLKREFTIQEQITGDISIKQSGTDIPDDMKLTDHHFAQKDGIVTGLDVVFPSNPVGSSSGGSYTTDGTSIISHDSLNTNTTTNSLDTVIGRGLDLIPPEFRNTIQPSPQNQTQSNDRLNQPIRNPSDQPLPTASDRVFKFIDRDTGQPSSFEIPEIRRPTEEEWANVTEKHMQNIFELSDGNYPGWKEEKARREKLKAQDPNWFPECEREMHERSAEIEAFSENPQFQTFKDIIRSNPMAYPDLLKELDETAPHLAYEMKCKPYCVARALLGPPGKRKYWNAPRKPRLRPLKNQYPPDSPVWRDVQLQNLPEEEDDDDTDYSFYWREENARYVDPPSN